MLIYSDGVSDINIKELIAFHKSHGKAMTMTSVQPDARFGALEIFSNNQVVKFKEKPPGESGWINAGFFICEPKIFDYIEGGDTTIFEQEPLINFLVNIKGFHTVPCQLLINNNVLKDIDYLKKTLVDYNISLDMSKDYDTIKEMNILFYRLKKDIVTRYLPKELEKDKKLLFEYVNLFCSKFCLSKIPKLINDSNFEEAKKIFFLAVSFDTRLINSTLFGYIHSNESYDVTHFESEYKLLFPSRLKSYELSKNSIKIKN